MFELASQEVNLSSTDRKAKRREQICRWIRGKMTDFWWVSLLRFAEKSCSFQKLISSPNLPPDLTGAASSKHYNLSDRSVFTSLITLLLSYLSFKLFTKAVNCFIHPQDALELQQSESYVSFLAEILSLNIGAYRNPTYTDQYLLFDSPTQWNTNFLSLELYTTWPNMSMRDMFGRKNELKLIKKAL